MPRSYDELLSRARSGADKEAKKSGALRLELPEPDVIWVGNKTIFRNYAEFPKLIRRDSARVLMYLAKELTGASLAEIGRAFAGKHHTTVLHSIQKIERVRQQKPEMNRTIHKLIDSIS